MRRHLTLAQRKLSQPPVLTVDVYSWASQFTSESRGLDWIFEWCVWPDAVREVIRRLEPMTGGTVALVGVQGVRKSSALPAIEAGRMVIQNVEYRKAHKSGEAPDLGMDVVHFKWHRESELLPSLLNRTHEASAAFHEQYVGALLTQVKENFPHLIPHELEEHPERLSQE